MRLINKIISSPPHWRGILLDKMQIITTRPFVKFCRIRITVIIILSFFSISIGLAQKLYFLARKFQNVNFKYVF